MKALKILGLIVGCFVLLLVVLSFTGFEPKDCSDGASLACRAPGLWLKGKPVTAPVTDWSFTDKIQTVKVQTETPFLIPYSVTVSCAVYNGNLYMTSDRGRHWVENVMRDPHVRLKIGDRVYDGSLSLVSDPVEKAAVIESKWEKYPTWKAPPFDKAMVFRVISG